MVQQFPQGHSPIIERTLGEPVAGSDLSAQTQRVRNDKAEGNPRRHDMESELQPVVARPPAMRAEEAEYLGAQRARNAAACRSAAHLIGKAVRTTGFPMRRNAWRRIGKPVERAGCGLLKHRMTRGIPGLSR